VQVTSIEPQVAANGGVAIRLRVAGDRDRAVQLVRNLERSRRFLHPRLAGETSQAKATTAGAPVNPTAVSGVEFEIMAEYNPLPANEAYHYAKPKVIAYAPGQTSVIAPTPMRTVRPAVVAPAVPVRRTTPQYPRNTVLQRGGKLGGWMRAPQGGMARPNAAPAQPPTAAQGGVR
jgi:type IV pilus assembly protein PilN